MLLALLLAGATSSLEAQARFGLKGGVAMANMYGDAVGNVDLRTGLTGGLFVEIPATSSLSIQVEGLYTQKGAVETALIDLGGGLTIAEGTWEYDYVDVAGLLKGTFGSGPTRISIYGGPVFSILMSAKAVGEGVEEDIKDFTKSNDIGGALGVSVEFSRTFLIDVRYSAGTSAIDQPPLDQIYARQQNVISAMVGFVAGG
jgi:hypothetical protein